MSVEARKRGRKAKDPKAQKIGAGNPVDLPMGTEVLLDRIQIAATLKVCPRRLDQLVAMEKYPAHDCIWQGRRRWKQSTHNAWVQKVVEAKEGEGA